MGGKFGGGAGPRFLLGSGDLEALGPDRNTALCATPVQIRGGSALFSLPNTKLRLRGSLDH